MKHISHMILIAVLGMVLIPTAGAGEWGLGAATAYLYTPYKNRDGKLLAVPYFSYQGERLNVDLAAISYSLLKTEQLQVALEGELRFEGYEADDSPELVGMASRNPSFDVGASVASVVMGGEFKVILLRDIIATHQGHELRVQYQKPYMFDRLFITPALGAAWLDEALVDYYYGVRTSEVTPTRPAYKAESTTNLFIELSVGYAINEQLELLGGVKAVWLGKSIVNSPIVGSQYDTAAFSAVKYKF